MRLLQPFLVWRLLSGSIYCLAHLEGDAMSLIRAMVKRVFSLSLIHLLYNCIFSHISRLDGFCYSFVAHLEDDAMSVTFI